MLIAGCHVTDWDYYCAILIDRCAQLWPSDQFLLILFFDVKYYHWIDFDSLFVLPSTIISHLVHHQYPLSSFLPLLFLRHITDCFSILMLCFYHWRARHSLYHMPRYFFAAHHSASRDCCLRPPASASMTACDYYRRLVLRHRRVHYCCSCVVIFALVHRHPGSLDRWWERRQKPSVTCPADCDSNSQWRTRNQMSCPYFSILQIRLMMVSSKYGEILLFNT